MSMIGLIKKYYFINPSETRFESHKKSFTCKFSG